MSVEKVISSALWAAYGDALGFMTELAESKSLVKRRTGQEVVSGTIEWKRKIGGKFGVLADLPAGCYSDDTQLRLATSRSIRSNGTFDVETFAKIELPVWLSYCLGAGRGSKAAASALTSPSSNWHTNFFKKPRNYFDCGGNGAAMRIQPHVWCRTSKSQMIIDATRNSLVTHGHPRGILGAIFHALCLDFTLTEAEVPPPNEWFGLVSDLDVVPKLIEEDDQLRTFWLPVWEDHHQHSFRDACKTVILECKNDIEVAFELKNSGVKDYRRLAFSLGGFEPETRGSGTKSAIIALGHSWLYRDIEGKEALAASANLLNSDTDTIGTMSGALIGAATDSGPDDALMDKDYILSEARRMWEIRTGRETESFRYPDLLNWRPPKTQMDSAGLLNGSPFVIGLGKAKVLRKPFTGNSKNSGIWQWLELEIGQSILCKRREKPFEVSPELIAQQARKPQTMNHVPSSNDRRMKDDLFSTPTQNVEAKNSPHRDSSIDSLSSEAIRAGFDFAMIGKHLVELSSRDNGIEKAIAYTSIISKAYSARNKR